MTDAQKKVVASILLVVAALTSIFAGWVNLAGDTKEMAEESYEFLEDMSNR